MPAPLKCSQCGGPASTADEEPPDGLGTCDSCKSEKPNPEPAAKPRSRRRRLWIFAAVFVALGGIELIGGVLLFLGYAVVRFFRRDDVEDNRRGDAPSKPLQGQQ